MPITIDWGNPEKTYILEQFEQSWTWEEYLALDPVENEMMDSVDHKVHIIADARGARLPDHGALTYFPKIVEGAVTGSHPNAGLYIIVGASRIIQTFAEIYQRVYTGHGQKVRLVKTMEDALALIESYGA